MSKFPTAKLLQAIGAATHHPVHPVSLHEPAFAGNEWSYVRECLDTGWVSSVGAHVDRFESMLAEYCGVRRAIAVVNGTAALQVSLVLAGVRARDEVLLPALTFVATPNAISYLGAIPHFVDSEWTSMGVDAAKLSDYLEDIAEVRDDATYNRRTGARLSALVVMHAFGHAADMDQINAVCQRFRITVVEDAAESLGSRYRGKHTGGLGFIGALSFNGNKIITTGGGGAILTNDEGVGRRAKHLTTTARMAHRWAFLHDEVGYNFRLPNLNAALGCAQLEQLDGFLDCKRRLAQRYREALRDVGGLTFFTEPGYATSNYWLNAIVLDAEYASERDVILDALNAAGWGARPIWTLMSKLPMYQTSPSMALEVAQALESRVINLPSSAILAAS